MKISCQLENALKKRIFGQDKAIKEISEIFLSSYLALLKLKLKPSSNFLLFCPSGVGKTETAFDESLLVFLPF